MRGNLYELQRLLDEFVAERGWQRYHRPKNLAMSVAIEAAELMEHFQWLDGLDYPSGKEGLIAEEMADVFIYLVRMADILDIDLLAAAFAKIAKNADKYPADLVRGSAKKSTEYELS